MGIGEAMDDRQFRRLLCQLSLSWDGYRRVRKGIKRRVHRHMQLSGFRNLEEYLHALDSDLSLRAQCERLMTVSISRFFRDRILWQILEASILPGIVEKERERVRVWSAGCACGEEVYSLKILWDIIGNRLGGLPDLEVLATDMNPLFLERGQGGIYTRSSLKEASEKMRTTYFVAQQGEDFFAVRHFLKNGISWRIRNLLHDPPEGKFHLVFLRNNLLTYYRDEVKAPAFENIGARIFPGGFLVIGAHEKPPLTTPDLRPVYRLPYLLQRQ